MGVMNFLVAIIYCRGRRLEEKSSEFSKEQQVPKCKVKQSQETRREIME